MILNMKPYKFFALVSLLVLGIIIADGIMRESQTIGPGNKIHYFLQVFLPSAIAAGVFSLFFVKHRRYKQLLLLCISFSAIAFLGLGYAGQAHYEGMNAANEWFLLFLLNPLEVYPFFLFTTLVSVGITTFCYFLGAGFEEDYD